jgi:leucine dehydrogenase
VPDTPLVSLDHEELLIRRGRRTGIYTVVAVHSTTLGPALGGCRMWRYENSADGARDALRLSRAMTYKASVAGVNLGGGKGVICLEPGMAPRGRARSDMLLDFADTVGALEGRYITAEDVGTSAKDMAVIERQTKWVTGRSRSKGGSGDPSPFTALGVLVSMKACAARRYGSPDLKGRSISVVGAGRVGGNLAKLLAKEGAKLIVADIDESRKELAKKLGASWMDSSTALLADVDILAPCALGGAIDEVTVDRIRCEIVCGAANNQLAHEGLAEDLHARGILYAPDFIANAGGLINVASEVEGYDAGETRRRVRGIRQTMERVFDEADANGATPLAAAYSLARNRLSEAGDRR